ncbi:MAG: hypothetical protein GX491_20290 [Chloroflexi bacterium]|nr:hypothetical protein [Chloroflexota bacterium]
MERGRLSRLTGVICIVGALFGLLISIGGLFALWSTRERTTSSILSMVELTGQALDATRATIDVVNNSLDQAAMNLALIRGIADDVAGTLDDSEALIESTAGLIGNDMAGFVTNTQTSLASVEASARLVDDTLRVISAIPLIGPRYQPEMPLQESVAQVSDSLTPLQGSFETISRQLDVSAAHVATMRFEIETLADQVDEIDQSITQAKEVVDDYSTVLDGVQARYDKAAGNLPLALDVIYIGLTALLVWIFITQLGLLIQGLEMF